VKKKITISVTPEEKEIIERYARAQDRPVSNLILHALRSHIRRSKRKDKDGVIIDLPEN
jgi:uncharacterized protein (DUF1778 family)